MIDTAGHSSNGGAVQTGRAAAVPGARRNYPGADAHAEILHGVREAYE